MFKLIYNFKMPNKEEILKKLLKNLLDERLKRLEKRNTEQLKDLKLEKDSYNKQGILLKKLCSVKIEPKKTLKKNMSQDKLRNRGRTPNLFKSRRKNSLNVEDKKPKRSKTPNMIIRKKKPEPKEKEKEKNEKLRKSKTPFKMTVKRGHNNTTKIPSYMAGTSSNMSKNRKLNDKNNLTMKKAITPDAKNRNKNVKKKSIGKSTNNDNNVKLIDIKIEDMKEYVDMEEKKPKVEEKKEEIDKEKEKEKINFELLIGNNKIINTLSSFLDELSQFNFLSCNKKLSKYLYEKLKTSLEEFKTKNNITPSSTIQDQINSLKLKYKSDDFNAEVPKFALSKGTVKAIDLLNDDTYNKVFRKKELDPPLDKIILVYRIFFKLLKDNTICKIHDDKLFWLEASEYILNNNNGKTGDFFKESINNFDFSSKNIYEIKKIAYGHLDKIKPSVYSKICSTTGLIIFLIKDAFEFIGILNNSIKNIPSLLLKYLEYIKDIESKIENYIEFIKKTNGNI